MVKKNTLTPVLAGILSLSVVGSGVGYYAMNKDGGESNGNKSQTELKTSPKLSVMAQNIENTLSTAEKAAKGELDYASDTTITITFNEGVTELANMDMKDVKLTTSTKFKGGNEETDASLYYGDGKLVSLEQLYEKDGEKAYIRVPEISDAYLTADKESLQKYMKDEMGIDFDTLTQNVKDTDIDYEALAESIKDYEQVVKDNFPEVKEEGKINGDIEGVAYEYTSKSYDITAADASRIISAVLEKAKTDENIKKMYDTQAEAQRERYERIYGEYDMEVPEVPTYEESIDEMMTEMKEDLDNDTSGDVLNLVIYEDGDEFTGFSIKGIEDVEMNFVAVSSDEAEGVDYTVNVDDGTSMTVYGAIKLVDDALQGGYTMTMKDGDKETVKVDYAVEDVKMVGDGFAGTIRVDFKADIYDEAISGWYELVSDSTEDKTSVSMNVGYNGKKYVTVNIDSVETEASDISFPGSDAKVFNVLEEDSQQEYLKTADTEGFMENAKSVLGDELYDEFFGSSYDYDDDYDYDFDDDFDFEEYDWEEFDTDELSTAAPA